MNSEKLWVWKIKIFGENKLKWVPLSSIFMKLNDNLDSPIYKLNRIIFPHLSIARQFLSELPGSPWGSINRRKNNIGSSCNNCSDNNISKIDSLPIELKKFPRIIIGLSTAWEISRIFNELMIDFDDDINNEIYQNQIIKNPLLEVEILCEDNEDLFSELADFISVEYSKWPKWVKARFSIIIPEYEIDYMNVELKRSAPQKKTRRPNNKVQQFLRRYLAEQYPDCIGNEYYGHRVFIALNQILLQLQKKKERINHEEIMNDIPYQFDRSIIFENLIGKSNNRENSNELQELSKLNELDLDELDNFDGFNDSDLHNNSNQQNFLDAFDDLFKKKDNIDESIPFSLELTSEEDFIYPRSNLPELDMNLYRMIRPPSPMKYYDLQELGRIELRFDEWITFPIYKAWEDKILQIARRTDWYPLMSRVQVAYNSFVFNDVQIPASYDFMIWSWNDFELLMKKYKIPSLEWLGLEEFQRSEIGHLYLKLTETPIEPDPRLELLRKIIDQEKFQE